MGLLIGIGNVRDNSGLAALGIRSFSSANNYTVGDYVLYSGMVYRFTTAHTASAWNADHAQYIGGIADLWAHRLTHV